MRLNTENYQRILNEHGITNAEVCKSTGLTEMSLNWILDNGFIELSTLERIADALGVKSAAIAREDITGNIENTIEFIRDGKVATLSFSQGRYISKIKKLAESHPKECQIVVENRDGSLCAHVPVNWIKITPPKVLNENQLKTARKNLLNAQSIRCENSKF